jgi:hypothetical protein
MDAKKNGGEILTSLGFCLRDEISSFLQMACSNLFEKIIRCKNRCKKEGEYSPALSFAASHDSGGEGVGGSGPLLCLWDENSSHPWMVCSSAIEK